MEKVDLRCACGAVLVGKTSEREALLITGAWHALHFGDGHGQPRDRTDRLARAIAKVHADDEARLAD